MVQVVQRRSQLHASAFARTPRPAARSCVQQPSQGVDLPQLNRRHLLRVLSSRLLAQLGDSGQQRQGVHSFVATPVPGVERLCICAPPDEPLYGE